VAQCGSSKEKGGSYGIHGGGMRAGIIVQDPMELSIGHQKEIGNQPLMPVRRKEESDMRMYVERVEVTIMLRKRGKREEIIWIELEKRKSRASRDPD